MNCILLFLIKQNRNNTNEEHKKQILFRDKGFLVYERSPLKQKKIMYALVSYVFLV